MHRVALAAQPTPGSVHAVVSGKIFIRSFQRMVGRCMNQHTIHHFCRNVVVYKLRTLSDQPAFKHGLFPSVLGSRPLPYKLNPT